MADLGELRGKIRSLDEAILKLVAERLDVARQIGQAKVRQKLPVKDYQVEKEVIRRARKFAGAIGLDPDFSEEIQQCLIKFACLVQEENRETTRNQDAAAKRILVVGGSGVMGRWVCGYFESFGHQVQVYDLAPARAGEENHISNLEDGAQEADVIVLSVPIESTGRVIEQIADTGTKALVFDICSLKSPFLKALVRAANGGLRICSIHPMFGPVKWLTGRKILLLDGPEPSLTVEAKSLFEESSAQLIRLPLERHDELMARILGLSHLTSLLFAATLAAPGADFAELKAIGSTTFDAQLEVTANVVRENPDLYFEIQSANLHSPEILSMMEKQLAAYAAAIRGKDRAGFKQMMEKSRRYFEEKL